MEAREKKIDTLIIGAGFGGLRMLHECRRLNKEVLVLEAGDDIGGTWYWNRYPGARTDTESWAYCFFFSEDLNKNYEFKERFATQEQALDYLHYAADTLDMRKDILLNSRVVEARYDEAGNEWCVRCSDGSQYRCQTLVSASGLLSVAYQPPFDGIDDFSGESYITGRWPKKPIDFRGKRVGVIGTGATAVQLIPILAFSAEELVVFQRTPNYVIPARNYTISEEQNQYLSRNFNKIVSECHQQVFAFPMHDSPLSLSDVDDEERERILEEGWEKGGFRFLFETFNDILINEPGNEYVAEFVRRKIRAIVKDPETAELLCPDYPVLAKRPPLGHFYYEAFNEDNVKLVDVSSTPIEKISERGVVSGDREFELDVIIYATGFDAATGALSEIDITGLGGRKLSEKWASGAKTNLGICVDEFPNFYMISGPQTPFANIPMVIDRTVDWIGKSMEYRDQNGYRCIEAEPEAVAEWDSYLQTLLDATLLRRGKELHSWFLGANIPGKPQSVLYYFGGAPRYFNEIKQHVEDGFPGFSFS